MWFDHLKYSPQNVEWEIIPRVSHVRSIIHSGTAVIPSDLWKAERKDFATKSRSFPPFSLAGAQKPPSPWSGSWTASTLVSRLGWAPPRPAESFSWSFSSFLLEQQEPGLSHYCKDTRVLRGTDEGELASGEAALFATWTQTETRGHNLTSPRRHCSIPKVHQEQLFKIHIR